MNSIAFRLGFFRKLADLETGSQPYTAEFPGNCKNIPDPVPIDKSKKPNPYQRKILRNLEEKDSLK